MFGLLAMVAVSSTLVLRMAMSQASTQSELELLTSLATRLSMMRSVHQRWLLHLITTRGLLQVLPLIKWYVII